MISHLFACLWIFFGLNENDDNTWLKNRNLLIKDREE